MMKRRPTSRRSSSSPTQVTSRTAAASPAKPRRTRADREVARHLLDVLKAGGDARATKIKQVRQKVRSCSYENELKLSIAIERMLGEDVVAQIADYEPVSIRSHRRNLGVPSQHL